MKKKSFSLVLIIQLISMFFLVGCNSSQKTIPDASELTLSILNGKSEDNLTQVNITNLIGNKVYQLDTQEEITEFYEMFSKVQYSDKIDYVGNETNGEIIKIELSFMPAQENLCFYISEDICVNDKGIQYVCTDSIDEFRIYLNDIQQNKK